MLSNGSILKEKEKDHSLLSIVIPAYNEEKYIGECLDYAISR